MSKSFYSIASLILCGIIAVAAVVAWLGWDERRPWWKWALVVAAIAVAGVAVLIVADLLGGGQSYTHLGVAVREIGAGNAQAAGDIARRKLACLFELRFGFVKATQLHQSGT